MCKRDVTLDVAKGIGIFLVVLGHFLYKSFGISELITDFIYSFHVELFFFISGFLYKKADMKATVSKVVKKFVIPAYIVGIADTIICLLNSTNRIGNPITAKAWFFTAFLTGWDGTSLIINDPIWFLMALSVVMVVKVLFDKNIFYKVAVTGVIIVACIAKQLYLPNKIIALSWFVNWTFCYIYFEAGSLFKRLDVKRICDKLSDLHRVLICVAEFVILVLLAKYNGRVIIACFFFGKSLAVTVISAFIGTDFALILSVLIKKHLPKCTTAISTVGRYSIVIMVTHYYITYTDLLPTNVLLNLLVAIAFTAVPALFMHLFNKIKSQRKQITQ